MAWFNVFHRRRRRRARSRQVREGWRRPMTGRGTFEVSEPVFEALADGLRLVGDRQPPAKPRRKAAPDDKAA